MNAASVDSEYEWRTVARERPSGLEVVLFLGSKPMCSRGASFFMRRAGTTRSDSVFATHDVVVAGSGLSSMLTDLAEQRIGRLE